jgi:hypothetical protein
MFPLAGHASKMLLAIATLLASSLIAPGSLSRQGPALVAACWPAVSLRSLYRQDGSIARNN